MWYFLSPKIVFGEDAVQELSNLDGEHAFIVTDQTLVKLGFVMQIENQLTHAGMRVSTFTEIEPDPSIDTVKRCAKEIMAKSPDWIVGFGGGSCLDAAKGAWFLYERPDLDLDVINPFENFGLRRRARFAAISTTSGTGADVSWGFALYDPETSTKLVRVSRELIPDLAIIDPVFVRELPPQLVADSGLDVLAHAIEAYTNTWHNDFSDAMALSAIRLIFRYLPEAYQNTSNLAAREHVHNAATMAGLAFSNSAIILAHALAHAVGSKFGTPHGRTVGLFLPYTIEFNAQVDATRYIEISRYVFNQDHEAGVDTLVKMIRNLITSLNQPVNLHGLGIPRNNFSYALPDLVSNTLSAVELIANPRQPTEEELYQLLECCYMGTNINF